SPWPTPRNWMPRARRPTATRHCWLARAGPRRQGRTARSEALRWSAGGRRRGSCSRSGMGSDEDKQAQMPVEEVDALIDAVTEALDLAHQSRTAEGSPAQTNGFLIREILPGTGILAEPCGKRRGAPQRPLRVLLHHSLRPRPGVLPRQESP